MVTRNDIEQDLCGIAQHDAAIWYASLKRPDTDQDAWIAFSEWLERAAEHRLAYEEVERLHETLDEAREALAPARVAPNIVSLAGGRRGLWLMAGAAAAIAASLLLFLPQRNLAPPLPQPYETQASETRRETLADGTTVDLNRGTAMTVAMTGRGREIRLDHGEALIYVAADPKRPLAVLAGGAEIRDIGTVFDVVRTSNQLFVGVEQGSVAVVPPGGGAPKVLAAGDRLAAKDGEVVSVSHGDSATVASWTQGVLVYEKAPFSKVADDLNRYGKLVIVQQGPDSSFVPISGVLEISDQAVMLERLGHMIPLAIDRSQEGRIVVRAPSGNR